MIIDYIKNKVVAPVVLAAGLAIAAYAPSVLAVEKPHTTVQVKDVKDGQTTYGLTTVRNVTVPSNTSLDDVVGLPQLVTPVGMPDGATPVTMPRGATPTTLTRTETTYVPTLAGLPEFDVGGSYGDLGKSIRDISNMTGFDLGLRYHPTGRDFSLGVHVGRYDGDALVNKGTIVKDAQKGPLAGSLKLAENRTADAELSATALGLTLQHNTLLYKGSRLGLGLGLTAGALNKRTTWHEDITTEKSIDGIVMEGAGNWEQQGGVDSSTSPYARLSVPIMIKAGNNGGGVCVTPSVMYSLDGDRIFGLGIGYCREN
ncbi:hypothetical protein HQ489_03115 [Candidatus Woesearchaeota archaeon]|nr:hypothetical protein [Candidatus Woesearchaeota archaeon]